jgi:photosystem II stability/assembly factor-like uncharacterized protein
LLANHHRSILFCLIFYALFVRTENLSTVARVDAHDVATSQSEYQDSDAANRWRLRVMRDEHGKLTANGRVKALRQFEANLSFWPARLSTSALLWTPQGPIDRGGRARDLVVDPNDPELLLAATGSGGVWKSEDGGTTWRPVTDKLGLPSGSLVINPRNSNTLYYGTGERFHVGGPGAGIYVSHDEGESWKLLTSTRRWRYIPAIAISPIDSNMLLAAVADPDFPDRSGVYRSVDAGKRWTRVVEGNLLTPSQILFQPNRGTRVLLAVREGIFPNGESRIMVSDDAGVTWRRSTGVGTMAFTRYIIAYAPSQPQIAFAVSTEGTFRSNDGGVSFTKRPTPMSLGLVSWAGMLWVSPSDPNLLLAGGVSLSRSRDGGSTWQMVNYSDEKARDVGHVDNQAAVSDSSFGHSGNHRVYILNDGGIDRLDDVQATTLRPKGAESLDHGMQTTEIFAVAGNSRSGLILGAAQDRGIVHINIDSSKSSIDTVGDGVCAIIDPSKPGYQYGCGQFLYVVRIQSDGLINLTDSLPDTNPQGIPRANFNAPVLLDPNSPKRMLAGGASLWRSENVRNATSNAGHQAKWIAIKPPLLPAFGGDDGYLISAVAIAYGNSNDIWVAHNNGELFHTRNGLAREPDWEAADDNEMLDPLPNRWPTRILIDASNTRRVYVAFGGFASGNLWVTDNGGMNWHKASGAGKTALPSAPIWSMAQHPQEPNTLIVGTEVGVYVTRNSGRTWQAIRAPFTIAAQDVSFLQGSNTLIVGTFGRGLWTIDLNNLRLR